jgi:hypothetical protein
MAPGPFDHRGIDLTSALNRIRSGFTSVSVNIRNYTKGGVTFRNLLTGAMYTLSAAVHSLKRLNDSTPNAPSSGFSIINGAGTVLSAWNSTIGVKNVATGQSGNPVSMVPFRPNASVEDWMYVADSASQGSTTLHTQYLGLNSFGPSGTPVDFVSNGMMKVSCNEGYTGTPTPTAVCWKMGIKEPQLAPIVSTSNSTVPFGGGTGNLLATAIPWTNNPTGTNSSFNYGETEGHPHTDPTTPKDGTIWYSVNVLNASYVTISSLVPNGTVVINGTIITTQAGLADISTPSAHTRVGAGSPGYPGQFLQTLGSPTPPSAASYVIGAFVDSSGAVMDKGVAYLYVPSVVDIGANIGVEITVPYGASSLQIGMNSLGNTYSSNSGSIGGGQLTISGTVTTNALPSVTSILGNLTAYYWGDSPAAAGANDASFYIWKNPSDPSGSGPVRTTSNADGSTTGNSFIFDATIGPTPAGIPQLPGIGTQNVPMIWYTLSPESVITGESSVFASPITSTQPNQTKYNDFNFCLTGNIYFPSGGPGVYYTLVLTSKDDCIWGIGGGVKLVPGSVSISGNNEGSSASISGWGQTITVVGGYTLLPRQNYTHGDNNTYAQTTLQVNPPAAGIYPIEVDYDYWYNSGRILLIMASPKPGESPTIIPPLPSDIRQEVQYRYCYRSSATGAQSNPSPESTAESIPVTANTITSLWSNDPQVDVVDYYRIDSTTSEFTYVATGPNDNLGGNGYNTAISDSLTDTELGTKTLDYDNYEPFPSIDLPQKGVCNVIGSVITWVSGGAIGGSSVGFSPRWLAGTEILIGSPTSLAYTFISRPIASSFQTNYLYPLNFMILDPSNHYQLVTVSGTSGVVDPTFNDAGGITISGGATFTDKGIYIPTGYVTEIEIPGVPDGSDVAYQIPEPILAAQPLPYLWGPTDNVNYCFGVGDPLRPGTLYWCKGSNLDSAPDTNQQEVCDPGEPLVNGSIAGGLGVLFSIKRAWLIMPNFSSATATATGTTGSTWTLQESSISRGLYIPRCVCVSGGGNIFFRVDDGIHVSPYGSSSQSISDQSLYPLFSHENSDNTGTQPQPITRNGITIYPPDDTLPNLQRFSYNSGYMYWDYQGTDGYPHTLVFDEKAEGWIYDLYNPAATIHASNEGQSQQGILVGCTDGTVRQLTSGGTETITGTIATPAFGGKGYMHVGQAVVEYSSTSTVTLSFYVADEGNNSYAPQTITLPSTGGVLTKYFFRPSAAKWKLLVAQFSSSVPFVLNLQGSIFYLRAWGSSGVYQTTPIFGESGGEG